MVWGFIRKELPSINNVMFSWNGIPALLLSRLWGNENPLSMLWASTGSFEEEMLDFGHR